MLLHFQDCGKQKGLFSGFPLCCSISRIVINRKVIINCSRNMSFLGLEMSSRLPTIKSKSHPFQLVIGQ